MTFEDLKYIWEDPACKYSAATLLFVSHGTEFLMAPLQKRSWMIMQDCFPWRASENVDYNSYIVQTTRDCFSKEERSEHIISHTMCVCDVSNRLVEALANDTKMTNNIWGRYFPSDILSHIAMTFDNSPLSLEAKQILKFVYSNNTKHLK